MRLEGIFPAVTTPLEGDRPAPAKLAENIAAYRRHGLAGFLVLGSTGEAALLTEDEKLALLRAAREAVPSGQPLIAGVGLESTSATISLARRAAGEGADALLVLTPFYFRSRMGEEALVRHFAAVADASPVPILLYNVPKFTGLAIPPAAVARLASHPNVAGLKDSSGDLAWMMEVRGCVPSDFVILCGVVPVLVQALLSGAAGGILAAADVVPEPLVALFERVRDGRVEEALELQRRVMPASKMLVATLGVAGIKAGVEERGLHGGLPRPPLLPVTAQERATVRETLAALADQGVLPELKL